MNYKIISSSSHGNCTIIEDIMAIDMGISFKKIEKYYKKLKIILPHHKLGGKENGKKSVSGG